MGRPDGSPHLRRFAITMRAIVSLSIGRRPETGLIIGSFDDVVAVPEPSMMSLIGCGVGGLVLLRRRRPA
jgi:hypothetical protein